MTSTVQTLLEACAVAVATSLNVQPDAACVRSLPKHLKDRLRRVYLRRGLLPPSPASAPVLGSLLHPGVTEVDLTECAAIFPEHLLELGQCRALRRLVLNNTKALVTREATGSLPSGLRAIHLRGNSVDDDALEALSTHCPDLREVDVSYCRRVGDTGALCLSRGCARLSSLGLACTGVGDAGLRALPPALRELRVDRCPRVTDEGVLAVLGRCARLRILVFHGCPRVTDRARTELEHHMAHLGVEEDGAALKQLTWTVY